MAGKFTKETLDKMNKNLQEDLNDNDLIYSIKDNLEDYDLSEDLNTQSLEMNVDIKDNVNIKEDLKNSTLTNKQHIEQGIVLAQEVKKETKEIITAIVESSDTLQGINDIYETIRETVINTNEIHLTKHIEHQKEINLARTELENSIQNRDSAIEQHSDLMINWPTSILGYALLGTGVVLGLAGIGYLLRNYWSDDNINANETIQPTTIIVEETITTTQTLNVGGFNIGNLTNQTTVSTITQTIPHTITQTITQPNIISPEILEKIDKLIKK